MDVPAWVREKPWWVLGLGAGAGFLAGRFLFSRSNESTDERPDEPRRPRRNRLGRWIAPLAAPIASAAIARVTRGMSGTSDGDPTTSPLERLAFGSVLTRLVRMLG